MVASAGSREGIDYAAALLAQLSGPTIVKTLDPKIVLCAGALTLDQHAGWGLGSDSSTEVP